jgi:PKD repeat protein
VYVIGDYQCEGTPLKYSVTIVPGTKPEAGPFEILCETTTHTFRGVNNAPTGSVGTWSAVPADGLVFDDIHKGAAKVSGLKPGTTYTFKWSFTGGSCVVYDTTVVTVLDKIKASFTKSAEGSCEPQEFTLTNTSTPQDGLTYKWYLNGTLLPANSRNLKLSADQVKRDPLNDKEHIDKVHLVKLVVEYPGCQVSSYEDKIILYAKPSAGIKSNKDIICGKQEVQIANLTAVSKYLETDYKLHIFNSAKDIVYQLDTKDFTLQKIMLPEVTKTDTFTVVLSAQNSCSGISKDTLTILAFPNTIVMGLKIGPTYLYGCGPHTIKIENKTLGADRYLYEIYKVVSADSIQLIHSKNTRLADAWNYTIDEGGTFRVKLTGYNNCSEASEFIDIVVGSSNAKFMLSRKDKTYCVGEEIGITFPGGKVDAYTWDFGDASFGSGDKPGKTYSLPGVYIIKSKGTKFLLGFAECVSYHQDTVTIIDRPKATFSTNAAASNCAPFVLDVKSTTANAFFVEWDFGDPTAQNNKVSGVNATHEYTKAGTYTVKVKVYNQSACADSSVQTIVINPKPLASLGAKQLICGTSATLNLKAADNPGHTGLVYEWRIKGKPGFIGPSSQNISHQFSLPSGINPPYSETVELTIKNPFTGCSDIATQEIEFKANPVPVITVLNASRIDCVPFKISVRNDTQFKDYVDLYEWVLDGVVYPGESPIFPDLDIPNKVYKLKLRVHNYDCSYVKESAEVSFTTRPMPVAAFELKQTEGCYGEATFELKSNGSTPGLTNANAYRWIIDGVPHSNLYTPPIKVLFKGEHKIQLIVSNGYCSDTTEKSISVINLEKPQVIASTIMGCGSQQIVFSAKNITDAKKFFWDFGDGYTDTLKNPVHTFYSNAAGKPYFVKLRVMNGSCFEDAEPVQVNIYNKPLVNFYVLPDSVIKAPNFTFNFLNASEGDSKTSYHWTFGDGATSVKRDPDHQYKTFGEFEVKLRVINEFGCDSSITRKVRIDSIPCYMYVPNAFEPNNSRLEISEFLPKAYGLSKYHLRIFTKYGQLIFESKKLESGIPVEGWKGDLNGGEAPQGVYIWDISGIFFDGTVWQGMSYSGPNGKKVRTGTLTLIR